MRATCERRRGILKGWLATAAVAIATVAIASGTAGVPLARAQQSVPVKAAEEARAAIEAWDAAEYYTRNGQVDKAAPFLEKFRKSRPIELWAAADFYMRKGQADKAVPYLDQLMKNRLDPRRCSSSGSGSGGTRSSGCIPARRPGRTPGR
jgi:hypothetical protein